MPSIMVTGFAGSGELVSTVTGRRRWARRARSRRRRRRGRPGHRRRSTFRPASSRTGSAQRCAAVRYWTVNSPSARASTARRSVAAALVVERAPASAARRRRARRIRARAARAASAPSRASVSMLDRRPPPRAKRSTTSINARSAASPSRTAGGSVSAARRPLRLVDRVQVEPEPRVGADRARVGRGQDDPADRVVGVVVRAAQQLRTDAGRLQPRPHDEQRESPDALALDGERAAGESPLVLGHPRPLGVVAHERAEALLGHGGIGRRRLGLTAAAAVVDPRRSRSSGRARRGCRRVSSGGSPASRHQPTNDADVLARRPATRLHGAWFESAADRAPARAAVQPVHARGAREGARRARAPRDHARPPRPRRVRPPEGQVALLDARASAPRSSRCSTTSASARRS